MTKTNTLHVTLCLLLCIYNWCYFNLTISPEGNICWIFFFSQAKTRNPSCPWLDWCGKSLCAMSICFQPSCQSHMYCSCTTAALGGFAVLAVQALPAVIPLRFSEAWPHNVRQSVTRLHRRHRSPLQQCSECALLTSSRVPSLNDSRDNILHPFPSIPSQRRASPSNLFQVKLIEVCR